MQISSFLANSTAMPPNLALLESLFPGRANIPAVRVGEVIGIAPQTTRNWLCAGKFPIPSFRQGGQRMCLKADVVAYLDRLAAEGQPKPKRGARTKAERIRAAANDAGGQPCQSK